MSDVAKVTAYAVLAPPEAANVAKAVGYAVLTPGGLGANVAKVVAYAVLKLETVTPGASDPTKAQHWVHS